MQIKDIEVGKLYFDPQNPRLPSHIQGDQNAILEWMLINEKIVELMNAIGSNGYFPGEALLIVPRETQPDNYYVVEGNRRLAAVKLLANPRLAKAKVKSVQEASESALYKPSRIPVIVFSYRDEILQYLGYRHITGVEPWDSLAKAKYLKQLFERAKAKELGDKYKELAKSIGSTTTYVKKLLVGLDVYEQIEDNDFFEIKGLDEESFSFSLLTTALPYKGIADFLQIVDKQYPDVDIPVPRLKELTEWVFKRDSEGKTRLGESRNLKYLNAIVGNQKALTKFRQGEPLSEAAKLTEIPSRIFSNALIEVKKRLRLAQNYLYEVEKPSETDYELLKDIFNIVRDLRSSVRGRLTEDEDSY